MDSGVGGRGCTQGSEGEVGLRGRRERLDSGVGGRGWTQGSEGEVPPYPGVGGRGPSDPGVGGRGLDPGVGPLPPRVRPQGWEGEVRPQGWDP